jgi:hypothetical protein
MFEVGCESGYGTSCDANTNWRLDLADSATNIAWTGITGKPTTIAGYAITDGVDLTSTQNITGVKNFLSNKWATSYLGANSSYALEAMSSDGGAAAMSFQRNSAYAVNLGLDPDNVFRLGGWSAPSARWQVDMSGNQTVAGSMTAGAWVLALGGSVFNSTNGYSFASPGDTDGGMFSPADGTLLLATNNVERMRVDSVGNVGIGTSAPTAKLTIGAAMMGSALSTTFVSNAGTLGTAINNNIKLASVGFLAGTNNTSLGIEARRTAAGTDWQTTAIGLKLDVDNSSSVNNSELWLNSNGNIGIDTATPVNKLSVAASAQWNSAVFDGSVNIW